ncbi:unnamed protein product [Moneuplotes crassus]|uniref:AAA+ ATPase domain-containing protein n=2 Tax=Euplotes crassus TaxID=5936 RepID=A0AAD2DBB1_EUPCR|nr:unnamed protein product [Moneuplotes crassus]
MELKKRNKKPIPRKFTKSSSENTANLSNFKGLDSHLLGFNCNGVIESCIREESSDSEKDLSNSPPKSDNKKAPLNRLMTMKNKATSKPATTDKQSLLFAKNAFENSIQEQVGFLRKQIAIGLVNKLKSQGVKSKISNAEVRKDSPFTITSEENKGDQIISKPTARFGDTLLQKIDEESEQQVQELEKVENKVPEKTSILNPNFLKKLISTAPSSNDKKSEELLSTSGINIEAVPKDHVIHDVSDFLKVFGLQNKCETDQFVEVVHPQTGFKIKILKDLVQKISLLKQEESDKVAPVKTSCLKDFPEPSQKPLKMNTAPSDQQAPQKEHAKVSNVMDFLDDMSIDDSFSDEEDEADNPSPEMKFEDGTDSEDPKNLFTKSCPINISTHSNMQRSISKDTKKDRAALAPSKMKIKRMQTAKIVDHKYTANEQIESLKNELMFSNNQIEKLKKVKQVSSAETDFNCHLAFMFASPLVRKLSKNVGTIMQLDYKNEISLIEKVFKNFDKELKYKTEVATINNFRSMIADPPFALHFTGHGVKNDKASLGSDYNLYKEKGDILLLEDENCMADYLFEKDLTDLIGIMKQSKDNISDNYEVVFVSSCHSEAPGKIFQNFGAHHVICIQKEDTVLDKASLRFSKVFYETLFMKKYSVCDAFNIAKGDIKSLFSSFEASKYLLFVNDRFPIPNTKNKFEHKCFPVLNLKPGKMTNLTKTPIFNQIPSMIENFSGRQEDMCTILDKINNNRLVNILGPPGIGKTAIACMICNNIHDRHRMEDGIIYLPLRGVHSISTLTTNLLNIIEECIDDEKEDERIYSKQLSINSNTSNDEEDIDPDGKAKSKIIAKCLKDKEVLIIFDGCEYLLDEDPSKFKKALNNLLFKCPDVKILSTSRKSIGTVRHFTECSMNLGPLEPQYSIRLLIDSVSRKIETSEIQELLKYKPSGKQQMNEYLSHFNSSDMTLTNHPLIKMLGGHPQAISLTAPWLEHITMTELFEKLMDTNMLDFLENEGQQSYASLRTSIDFLIQRTKKNNIKALELFQFIGLFPEGIKQVELAALWGDKGWQNLKFDLLSSSMVTYKNNRSMLILLPIMTTRARELLDKNPKKKAKFHQKCCQFYKDFLSKFLEKINNREHKESDLIENERNIWACIYRAVNKKAPTDDYDEAVDESERRNSDLFPIKRVQTIKLDLNEEYESDDSEEKKNTKTPAAFLNAVQFEESDHWDSDSEEEKDRYHTYEKRKRQKQVSLTRRNNVDEEYNIDPCPKKRARRTSLTNKVKPVLKTPRNTCKNSKDLHKKKLRAEEAMVVYYISICIRLCKLSDARKAITEYLAKPNISALAKAQIYQFQAFLSMMHSKISLKELENSFIKAIEEYKNINCGKGIAICNLGILVSSYFHIETKKHEDPEYPIKLSNRILKIKEAFEDYDFKLGVETSENFIQYTTDQYKVEETKKNVGYSRLVTFKESQKTTLFFNGKSLQDVLLNEDSSKILTLVIEKNVKPKNKLRNTYSHLESVYHFLNNKHAPKKKKMSKVASLLKLNIESLQMKEYNFKMKTMVDCKKKNEVKLLANRPKSLIKSTKVSFQREGIEHD